MRVNADNRLPADPGKLDQTTAFALYAIFRDFARAINGTVSDSAYAADWDGDTTTAPSKNAVYDKIQTLGAAAISDAVYGVAWNGDTTTAPSKNAVYDKIETIGTTPTYSSGFLVMGA